MMIPTPEDPVWVILIDLLLSAVIFLIFTACATLPFLCIIIAARFVRNSRYIYLWEYLSIPVIALLYSHFFSLPLSQKGLGNELKEPYFLAMIYCLFFGCRVFAFPSFRRGNIILALGVYVLIVATSLLLYYYLPPQKFI